MKKSNRGYGCRRKPRLKEKVEFCHYYKECHIKKTTIYLRDNKRMRMLKKKKTNNDNIVATVYEECKEQIKLTFKEN